jgi:hypothetical protein
VDETAVTDDAAATASGIAHAPELLAFAEAAVRGSDAALADARATLHDRVGAAGLVDAAAVVGNFERMVRIADATGIPLDAPVTALTTDIREALGIDRFGSAVNTPAVGLVGGLLGRVLRPVAMRALRFLPTGAGERGSSRR